MLSRPRSLRTRIALAFLVWASAFQLAVAVFIPVMQQREAYRTADAIIREFAEQLLREAELGRPGAEARLAAAVREGPGTSLGLSQFFFAQLRRLDGEVIASSDGRARSKLPLPRGQSPEPGEGRWRVEDVSTGSLAPAPGVLPDKPGTEWLVRTATYRVNPPEGPSVLLQVSRSAHVLAQTLATTGWYLGAALVAGMIGSAVAGWIVAGMVVRNLDEVARAVREVAPDRLELPAELPGTGDEMGRVVDEVRDLLARLRRLFRSQEQFLAHVSHELKTPVSALLTEAQVLKYSRPDERGLTAFVLGVEDEMRRLGKMVESLLMLARFGHGKRFIAETIVAVNDVALEAVHHAGLLAGHHGVALSLDVHDPGESGHEALIKGDPELLRVAVDNLIRNAVQISTAGTRVHTRVTTEGADVLIQVIDEGPGLAPEQAQRLFNRFAEIAPPAAGKRGTGLGLTIVQAIVEVHEGSLDVRNRETRGCTFTIRLPRRADAGGGPPVPGVHTNGMAHAAR